MLIDRINKTVLILILFLCLNQINIFSQQGGIVNNIVDEIYKDNVQIFYNLSGDTSKIYDVKLCIKDSTYRDFALYPKILQGNIGKGKFARRRNVVILKTDDLPDDFVDKRKERKKYYYEITATEVLDEINYKDVNKLSKSIISNIKNGVAIVLGIENDQSTFITKGAELFKDYCAKIFKIPYNKIRYEINDNVTKANLESIFWKDGWLHNKISDGVSDVIIYFSGRCTINEIDHDIYLLPYNSRSFDDGFSLNDLISSFEGFNPRSLTFFIESSLSQDINKKPITNIYFYPNPNTGRIKILMASRSNQNNNYNDDEGIGLFTYEVLKGLSGFADLNKDRAINFKELYEFVKTTVWNYSVKKLNKEQDPVLFPNLEEIGQEADDILIRFK